MRRDPMLDSSGYNVRTENPTIEKYEKYHYRILNELNLKTQAGANSKKDRQLQRIVLNTIKEIKKIQ